MAKEDPITDKQSGMIAFLMRTRDSSNLPEAQEKFLRVQANWARMNRQQASNAIAALLLCDVTTPQTVTVDLSPTSPVGVFKEGAAVPAGRYFIVDPTDNVEKFFKVDKPEAPSRWAGYVFVSVQASDDFYPIKDRTHREAVLAEIAKDPIDAMNNYGIRLGICGCCGRTLTAVDSRLLGIGPICAAKLGVQYGGVKLDDEQLSALLESEDE